MKLLILTCLLGCAAASFLQKAAPAVDDAVSSFLKGTEDVKSLGEVLNSNDPVFSQIEDDIKTELGKKLKEALDYLLERIVESIEHGKDIGKELRDKVKDLREKLKDLGVETSEKAKELLRKIKEKAKEILRNLLEKLGLGKRNLDHEMDAVARMNFKDIVEKMVEEILSNENIQKIREYIRKLESEHPIVQKLKELVQKLRDSDIKQILHQLLDSRSVHNSVARGETWDKIKEYFKDLKIEITEHTKKFGEWLKDMWGRGLDKAKEKHGIIKGIALEFISNAKDISAEVAREALEFFRPYKEDLGTLWKQIVDATKEAIGSF